MKKNNALIFSTTVFGISLVLTTLSVVLKVDAMWLNILFTLAPVIVFYLQSLIEHQDKAFILWNKFKVWRKNPPLEWRKTITIAYSQEIQQQDLNDFFSIILKEDDYSSLASEKPVKLPSAANRFRMKFGITIIDMIILSENTLKLECYSKINYRQSKVEINQIFDYVYRKISNHMQKGEVKEYFSLKIKFANENPFYGLYVRRIEMNDEVSFMLKYSLEDVNYLVSNRTIEATTSSKEKLDKVSNDFLVLAES